MVEGARLESVCAGNRTEGSNPSLSARKNQMKLLVYAFEPFGQDAENISQQVLKRLRSRKNVMKMTLPVEFNSTYIIDAIENIKPGIILGLGQYPRGNKIRIERLAKNQQKSKGHLQTSITKNGPAKAFVTLELQPDINSRLSYNAGRYVCNYSIYVLLTNATTKDIPLAFLHIPKKVDVNKATEMVEHKIDEILAVVQKIGKVPDTSVPPENINTLMIKDNCYAA